MNNNIVEELYLDSGYWKDNTEKITRAIEKCKNNGFGKIVITTPLDGVEIGSIKLCSNLELYLNIGSKIKFALKEEAYENSIFGALLEAENEKNIVINGFGTFDGCALDFMNKDLGYIYEPKKFRPRMLVLIKCENITISNLTFKDSPFWTLHPIGCKNILFNGITIDNNLKVPNCDGIDPDHCQDVRIIGCSITSADDCIVLKTTKEFASFGKTSRICIMGCTLKSTSAAIKLGSESVCDFEDVVISNCVISSSSRAIAFQLRDKGNINIVRISNCILETRFFEPHWWGQAESIYMTSVPRFSGDEKTTQELNTDLKVGKISNVVISDITSIGENGVVVYGIRDSSGNSTITDVTISNLILTVKKTSKWIGGKLDLRPFDAIGPKFRDPNKDPGLIIHECNGVYVNSADNINLKDIQINWLVKNEIGYSSPLEFQDCNNLKINQLEVSEG